MHRFLETDIYIISVMRKPLISKIVVVVAMFLAVNAFSKDKEHGVEAGEKDVRAEIKEYIAHHLLDTHDFSLFSYTAESGEHVYVGFPLPVMLWDDGLKVFSSSKLHHGEAVVASGGNFYKLDHGKIYRTDEAGTINYDDKHHATNIKPVDFSITKNVFFIGFIALVMLLVFSKMAKNYKKNPLPSGIGRVLEPLVVYVRDEIAIPNIGKKHYKKFMSYLLTVFFFVWIINLFGLTPLGINVTNNIAVTLALALITFVLTTINGNKNYWKHIFWMPGVPTPMKIILAPIELLGTIIKPFSLMIRLYANITAGHIVLMSIIGLMFFFKSWIGSPLSFALAFALSLLELLVAALQAYIFTMLSALYFGSAVEEEH